ncbi:MAG: hypothetical protein Ct9H300mP9_2700 [Candidatus Neomarinimicrobiota bacterium]|nr:MAG: hypothetical protein Ct9H300mP9_2700 [Candidatus Neomarinimicrobiota bacterium]
MDAQRDYEGIPGISIALVHNQELLWSGGFGFSNPDKRNPPLKKNFQVYVPFQNCSPVLLSCSYEIRGNYH